MVSRTHAIKNFLISQTHKDLSDLYNYDMEVQVNVACGNGTRVDSEFKGRQWNAWTDGIQTWYPFRIPKNANSEPEYNDSELKYDLIEHAEGIGMTGWNWEKRESNWVAFDFDGIAGHSEKHEKKLTDAELKEVEKIVSEIPWVTLRRSTSGKGLHIYVHLIPVTTKNHTEHAALARAILGLMSAVAGFNFGGKVDVCGGNMWVWHRKMKNTDGLVLLKQGLKLTDVPSNWQDHIKVISGRRKKNLPFFIAEEASSEQLFNELTSRRTAIPLDEGHRKLIKWMQENNCQWWWDNDHHMLVCHTYNLKQAHEELDFRGVFETIAEGSENGADHNCFAFPLRGGAWTIRRYSRGVAEAATWDQDGDGWTRCYYNRDPDLQTAARCNEGCELISGGFTFRHAELALKAANTLGTNIKLPTWALGRETILKQHKDGRLIMCIDKESRDRGEDMEGWQPDKNKWVKIFSTKIQSVQETEIGNFDDLIRHLVTESSSDYGWVLKSEIDWRIEPLEHIKIALRSMGHKPREVDAILGRSVFCCWTLINKPFQPEYGLDRRWNREAAQLRFFPSENRDDLSYPTWLSILNHCGHDLDSTVKENEWCKSNNILTGSDYLKIWIASLFKEPLEPLPYLFFYGPQSSGKSIFHEALSLLITHGCVRADNALISQSGFNGELEQAVLCVIEETDLRKNKTAYNRIKDWVTSPFLPIHRKQRTPYTVRNCTHWIQCANDYLYCPVFMGDTRITMIHVAGLEKPIPKKQLFPLLEKEAPDFLAEILGLELPMTNDRLNIPIIITEEKLQAEKKNQTSLEMFLNERCYYVTGRIIKFSEFYEAFKEWLDPSEVQYWTKSKVGRELPKPYIRGRLQQTGQHYIANMSWTPRRPEDEELPSISIKGEYLHGVKYELFRSYCLERS